MKLMKYLLVVFLALSFQATAQTNPPLTVKGDMNINYVTRQRPAGTKGVQDKYDIRLNVANSVLFHGDITDRPQIIETTLGFNAKVTQARSLKFDVDCDIVNPNPNASVKSINAGKMAGFVPISSEGTYNFDKGTLSVDILPRGNAGGFSSKFGGSIQGKPLVRPADWSEKIRQTVSISRIVNGKPMVVALTRYDQMNFDRTVLAQGPVQIYQPVTVNGNMYYDYAKNCWFFKDFTVQYNDNGNIKIDRIAGTIRWVKDKDRKKTGLGEYQFDLRVNEPIMDTSAAAFAAPSDESAFFSTDTTMPSLTGTMKYKDQIKDDGSEDGITLSSVVAIDLNGALITKPQVMVMTKVLIFACVIPMNAD